MDEPRTLNHSKWECKYHVVFIPKYRKKTIYVELRPHLGVVFRDLAKRKGCEIEEGHVMADHVHMLISIPPKYAVSQVIGYMKGKAAIYIARDLLGRNEILWARISGLEDTLFRQRVGTKK